ncbi:ABCB family ABC transporter ATP-binding protein/permease [Rubrimonas cliftonensis]|uniref:ATP-binding cassette, subfamily B n=1 Tax=Rubrimonas cliftonensis TaxID=89524 RepID=A0A1H4DPR3_9RHOB|nr:ABC transporter ATP-binding protein/permease [Rubrimonas cliftonensis]SEA74192.1 ATP-binding cassette, subfamily B [Rubrimonas cliftonensis]
MQQAPSDASDLAIVRRVAPYLWPAGDKAARARVIAALAFLTLAKLATVLTPVAFKFAVDGLEAGAGREAALLSVPVWLVLAYGAARLLGVGFTQARDAVFARVGQRALRRLALETFGHIHALSLRYHLSRKTGGLSRVIERGVKAVDFLLRFLLFSIAPLILELGMVALIFLLAFDWRYCLVVVAAIGLYVWFTFAVTEWRVKIREKMNAEDQDAAQKAVDSLLNFETVKYFGAERREAARYDGAMAGYEDAAVRTATSLAALNAGQAVIITAAMVLVMGMAAIGVTQGALTVGDFVMVNAYMIQITMPLNFLGTVYREIRQALVDMRAMFGLLDANPEIRDAPGAAPLVVSRGAVAFDDVRFGYDGDRPILKGVSFSVQGGRTLAVVGPSGAGKSTISRLMFRFYDATSGAIRVDGQDIRAVTQASLRSVVGVVPQDTVLFNDTIGYNIAYGREGATRAEVEAAARSAAIHGFIERLPQGYETQVGERGLKLSGGEKQRVAIARTILKNPPILILDEATSALDSQTEQEIQDQLRQLGRDRTVIMIAHRLSTVTDADEIIVLDAGEVVERGTHAALVARGGRYAAMWRLQQESEPA